MYAEKQYSVWRGSQVQSALKLGYTHIGHSNK